jgi:hypothetical protein
MLCQELKRIVKLRSSYLNATLGALGDCVPELAEELQDDVGAVERYTCKHMEDTLTNI